MTQSIFEHLRPMMQDLLGPLVAFPPPCGQESDFSVLFALMPPGTLVPLHSHADREFIVVVAGTLSIWVDGSWRHIEPGRSIDVLPDARHSLLNSRDAEVALILVTTPVMRKFMQSISIPAVDLARHPTSERVDNLVKRALEYGYWLGTPADQAALGAPPQ